jgi:hypothetical protein
VAVLAVTVVREELEEAVHHVILARVDTLAEGLLVRFVRGIRRGVW